MDELLTIGKMAPVLSSYGLVGLMVTLWYMENKTAREQRKENRDLIELYRKDMEDMRRMYEDNVKLVESWEDVSGDMKDIIIMNTQAFQRLSDDIEQNQFCPQMRVEKKTVKVGR